jgi:hypothetical protein
MSSRNSFDGTATWPPPALDPARRTLLYHPWGLDAGWRADEDADRWLLLEPEFFAEGFQTKGIEQKPTKATKEKPPPSNCFVTFVSFCSKNQFTA